MDNQTPDHHIHYTLESIKQLAAANPNATASNEMVHRFAFLLSKLAEQTDRSSRRMDCIARITLAVAATAAFLTLAQCGIALIQICPR
jgi:hypothetical protein